ncbi:hypothetical protein EKN09_29365 [Vibrio penaeicida]|nr:VOC family protein [Vibrio penaeicida]RTZ18660.1 hypothetical protein EKN09_29365 [Vibrio penaeicida]
MMSVDRLMTTLCTHNLLASKQFYQTLFGFNVGFESEWFIQLVHPKSNVELGLITAEHELVPPRYQGAASGLFVTLVVEDVDAVFKAAEQKNYVVLQTPEPTFYGQKRLLLEDPAGVLVDVSTPLPI